MSEQSSRLESVVRTIATTCVEQEKYFSDLDAVAGDGDFGYSLARGFEVVLEQWDDFDRSSPSVFLQKVAITMSGRIGGTSGPIWGTAFLRAAGAIKDVPEPDAADVVRMLNAAIEGIKARGGADVGDKTLLDALVPLTATIEDRAAAGAGTAEILAAAAETARSSAEATSALQARRGRASYTGERSIGSPDPGAIAVAVLTERIRDGW